MSGIDDDPKAADPTSISPPNVIPIEEGYRRRREAEQSKLEREYDAYVLDQLERTSKGRIKNRFSNLTTILEFDRKWWNVLGFDTFSQKIVLLRPSPIERLCASGEWSDLDYDILREWFGNTIHIDPNKSNVRDAVQMVARKNPVHAVARYLDGLVWDGVPRLDTLFSAYFGAEDSSWIRLVGPKWCISAVARAYVPGCRVDTMIVLEGEGGMRKSTALSTLAGDAWFTDHLAQIGTRDAATQLQGVWIVELSEMESIHTAASVDRVKEFLSRRFERHVHKWQIESKRMDRGCVFAGTCNHNDYLRGGDTGEGRRFWPIEITRVADINAIAQDRDQIWAEAVVRYKKGERWWFFKEEDNVLTYEKTKDRAEEDAIQTYIAKLIQGRETTGIELAEIMAYGFGDDSCRGWGPREQKRVVRALRALGWEKRREPRDPNLPGGGRRPWRYRPIVPSPPFQPSSDAPDATTDSGS